MVLLPRAGYFKMVEYLTAVYDPYTPYQAQLGPADWVGWPNDALEPSRAVDKLKSVMRGSGEEIEVRQAVLHHLNDKAATFAYQSADVRQLRDLSEKYDLQSLVGTASSQIDELTRLNDWVRRQWKHGGDEPVDFDHFYAGTIIEAGRRGEQFWCHVAAMTFSQIVLSMGYQARVLSLFGTRGAVADHAVSEVWVDDFQKWVVFDTDFNIHYTDESGTPLNALELHNAFKQARNSGVRVVKGQYRPEVFDVEQAGAQPYLLPYYRHFYIDMRNDWLTNAYFPGHPKRSDKATMRWIDHGEAGFLDLKPVATEEGDMYWPLNLVEVRLGVPEDKRFDEDVSVYLKTITPNFDHYEVSLNDSAPFPHRLSKLKWSLMPGLNRLVIQAVNAFGKKGAPTVLEISRAIRLKPTSKARV